MRWCGNCWEEGVKLLRKVSSLDGICGSRDACGSKEEIFSFIGFFLHHQFEQCIPISSAICKHAAIRFFEEYLRLGFLGGVS